MKLSILLVVFFLIAFIVLSIKGYKKRSYLYQFVALNSFIALTSQLKEIVPPAWDNYINSLRIVLGLIIVGVFFYGDFMCNKTKNN